MYYPALLISLACFIGICAIIYKGHLDNVCMSSGWSIGKKEYDSYYKAKVKKRLDRKNKRKRKNIRYV